MKYVVLDLLCTLFQAKLGKADAGDNVVKLMMKHAQSGFEPSTQ